MPVWVGLMSGRNSGAIFPAFRDRTFVHHAALGSMGSMRTLAARCAGDRFAGLFCRSLSFKECLLCHFWVVADQEHQDTCKYGKPN